MEGRWGLVEVGSRECNSGACPAHQKVSLVGVQDECAQLPAYPCCPPLWARATPAHAASKPACHLRAGVGGAGGAGGQAVVGHCSAEQAGDDALQWQKRGRIVKGSNRKPDCPAWLQSVSKPCRRWTRLCWTG